MTGQNMRCEDALRLLAQYLDRELDELDRKQLELHVQSCRSCSARTEFERRLKQQLALLKERDVPSSIQLRIRELVRGGP